MGVLKGMLENLAKQGVFGEGSFLRVVGTSDSDKRVQFQSELEFLRVDLIPATGKITRVPIVVKTQVKDDNSGVENGDYVQLLNEVNMYKIILPNLGATNLKLCSKIFYGETANSGETPGDDIVIMEDLRPKGYKISNSFFLDYDHVMLAMNKLGQLHGLSYKLKTSCPEKLMDLRKKLIPKLLSTTEGIQEDCLVRGIQPVADRSPSYSVVRKVYKKITGMSFVEFTSSLQKPEEPFAVIAHGDYNGNNLMFKYDDSGKVVGLKMINFGYSNYLDPAVDISFILYLNTSPEMRTLHWDAFLKAYWNGVTSVAVNPGFTHREFHHHFSGRAIVGYGTCCSLLPIMMTENTVDFRMKTPAEKKEYFNTMGGEEATAATSAIISHLMAEGYLDAYLNQFDSVQTSEDTRTPGYTKVTYNFA